MAILQDFPPLEQPPHSLIDSAQAGEIRAALALGRLRGALEYCASSTLRVFAGQVLRDTLMSALRREGYAFTDLRFHAWFAGLVTLCDSLPRHGRSARAVCDALLTELTHSSCQPMADLARVLIGTFLAPGDMAADAGSSDAHAIIADASALVQSCATPSALPGEALDAVYHAATDSIRFKPIERSGLLESWDGDRLTSVPSPLPAPLWAMDLVVGEALKATEAMPYALPFPGLFRNDGILEADPIEARAIRTAALCDSAGDMIERLRRAAHLSQIIEARAPARRGTSRSPALFELLSSFGPMRSAQIEAALGASRLGVRGMIQSLEALALVKRTTVAGSHLYDAVILDGPDSTASAMRETAFSDEALGEYEASLADIDRLLAGRTAEEPGDEIA